MRIGIDAHVLTEKFQGSRTYLLNLLRYLPDIDSRNEYIIYSGSEDETRAMLDSAAARYEFRRLESRDALGRLLREFPRAVRRERLDVLHNQYISPPFARCRKALTIHDILYESLPRFFPPMFVARSRLMIRHSARKAALIFTISNFSRNEIIERYKVAPERVRVTYLAVDHERFQPLPPEQWPEESKAFASHRPFLLFVGRLDPRKNIPALVEAVALRKRRGLLNEKLIITGPRDYRHKEVFQAIERHRLQDDVVFLGGIEDRLLPALFNMAELFVYPSYGEGFGLPVVEAMACGTPVVTTDRGSLGEVAGAAAIYVDPDSPESIEAALDEVLGNEGRRNELRSLGMARAKKFEWRKCAEGFHEGLQALRSEFNL